MALLMKPIISAKQVSDLLKNAYNVNADEVSELCSYEDRNFKITADDKQVYLMKISCLEYTENISFLRNLSKFLLKLSEKIPVQHPIKCLITGEYVTDVTLQHPAVRNETSVHAVRLLTFLPGQELLKFSPFTERTSSEVGKFMAKFHNFSKEIPDLSKEYNTETIWSMNKASSCLEHLDMIPSRSDQTLVEIIFEEIKSLEFQDSSDYPQCLIHGDPNEHNIIYVDANAERKPTMSLIDWQDCTYSCRVFDLAILVMSLRVMIPLDQEEHFKLIASTMIRSYDAVNKLTKAELACITLLACARYAFSMINGLKSYEMSQYTNEYVLFTNKQEGWPKLRQLYDSMHILTEQLKATCCLH